MVEIITGSLEHIVFHNEQNGYTVADFDIDGSMVTCVGIIDGPREGLYLKLTGSWITHPVFGEQFKFESCSLDIPTTESGLVRYLSSGLLPGIREKKAKDIVDHFGTDVLDILDHSPERLKEISGIGEKTLAGIIEAYAEQREIREVLMALQEYGISVTYGMKLYNVYKQRTVNVLMNDPYRMIKDVNGIGFRVADHIASLLGVVADHPKRLEAGVIQSLRVCYASGNTYMDRHELVRETSGLLGIYPEEIEDTIDNMIISGELRMEPVDGKEAFYPPMLFEAEDTLALNMVRLFTGPLHKKTDNSLAIQRFEKEAGMKLDHSQHTAVDTALDEKVTIITGGPGTGKTTIVSALIDIFSKRKKQVVLCAPTGRAAKRMSESTGMEAQTIHRLLEYEPIGDESILCFNKDEEHPIEADVVIVDEASMVDTLLMAALTRALTTDMQLILVGDVDQLPSVGPGQVLRDFIECELIPVVRLTAVYRQEKGSAIAEAAFAVNSGSAPDIPPDGDITYLRKQTGDSALESILALAKEHKDIQIITPMKKGILGTISLNDALQRTLNPPSERKKEKAHGTITFREGDKVMQIKNDYKLPWVDVDSGESGTGVFNGDIGVIRKIDLQNKVLTVQMIDDKVVEYPFDHLTSLTHAYAMTIHKSQGSEFSKVILPLVAGPPGFLTRKLLYTAITRAKSGLYLVGPWQNLIRMVYSDADAGRRTGLKARITLYQAMFN